MRNSKQRKTTLRRFLDGVFTKEEATQVFQDIIEPETMPVYDQLANEVWEESAYEKQIMNHSMREQYKKEARQLLESLEKPQQRSWYRIGAVAASIAVIICFAWGGFHFVRQALAPDIIYLEASTSYGERKQLLLPDGTQLILNSCSYIRYPKHFTTEERKIELAGEGYFNVAHDEYMPFIISTSRMDIRVLGTSFNVKSYPMDEIVSVSVESGKVQVDVPDAVMRLVANEQIYINTLSDEYSKRKGEGQVAVWMKGSLYFNKTPIRDVAKELERSYNCRITFNSNQTFDNLISGEHDNIDLESVLKSIEYTSGIKYKKDGRNILLYK